MKKINELSKLLKITIFKNETVFNAATRFRDYLTRVLLSLEMYHLQRNVDKKIASWENVSDDDKKLVRIVMGPTMKAAANATPDKNGNPSMTRNQNVFLNLEVARRVVTGLSNIVGIQPMQAPVGLAYMLSYKTGGDARLTLEVISQAIEASSRKLSTSFVYEAASDLKLMHGLNLEDELINIVASQIAEEVLREVISDLLRLGTQVDISELGLMGEPQSDTAAFLAMEIRRAATSIARTTMRGGGNFVIVPIHVLSSLQELPDFKSALSPVTDFTSVLEYAGKLSDIEVYASNSLLDEILVGYKGTPGNIDGGYFYAPYLPVVYGGIITNPETFQPMAMFMTRYGKCLNGERATAQEYYRVLKLSEPAA